MVRSKSSGHLSESQSSLLGAPVGLLGAPPTGERLLLGASSSSGERRFLGERYHPGERLLGASSGERILLGERFQAGENRAGTTSSLPISLNPSRFVDSTIPHHHHHHHRHPQVQPPHLHIPAFRLGSKMSPHFPNLLPALQHPLLDSALEDFMIVVEIKR